MPSKAPTPGFRSFGVGLFVVIGAGLLNSIGGILGNLIAADIEHSLGDGYTLTQLIGLVVGILIFSSLISVIKSRPQRNRQTNDELQATQIELSSERNSLRQIQGRIRSGIPVSPAIIDAWLEHQARIRTLKEALRAQGGASSDDPIDNTPPPNLGCMTKATLSLKQALAALFLSPFFIALVVSLTISPVAQRFIIEHRPTPPNPGPVETVVPTTVATAISTPVPTLTIAPSPEPTRETPEPFAEPPAAAAEPDTSSSPTPEVLIPFPTPTNVQTAAFEAAVARETQTAAELQTSTLTPLPSPSPSVTGVATAEPTSQNAPITLVAPGNNSEVPGNPVLEWRDDLSSFATDPYIVVIEHSGGTNYDVTSASSWQVPTWLQGFQPEGGYRWWVAVCTGAAPGSFSSQPCTATSRTSEVWRFQWRP